MNFSEFLELIGRISAFLFRDSNKKMLLDDKIGKTLDSLLSLIQMKKNAPVVSNSSDEEID